MQYHVVEHQGQVLLEETQTSLLPEEHIHQILMVGTKLVVDKAMEHANSSKCHIKTTHITIYPALFRKRVQSRKMSFPRKFSYKPLQPSSQWH
jgi:hypothetical protein